MTNVNSRSYLQELAAVIDVGEHFVKATYNLEGDGASVLWSYEEIKKVRAVLQAAHYCTTSCSRLYNRSGMNCVKNNW